jgi:hypothetical protein
MNTMYVVLWLTIEKLFGYGLLIYGGLSYEDCPVPGIMSMIPGAVWIIYSSLGIWAMYGRGLISFIDQPRLSHIIFVVPIVVCHIVVLITLRSTCKEFTALIVVNSLHFCIQILTLAFIFLRYVNSSNYANIERTYITASIIPIQSDDEFDLERPYCIDE